MQHTLVITLAFLAVTPVVFAQEDRPTFQIEAASAFVWGEDTRSDAASLSIRDPVTGNAIHKLNHGGIEVSSRAGFERIGLGEAGEYLSFATTIVNNTASQLFVRQGRASADGHVAIPLSVAANKRGSSKKHGKQLLDIATMHCVANGFLPDEAFFTPNRSSKPFIVDPQRTLAVSFVTKDPRYYSVLCSVEGCYPKGTIRFSVTVNTTDYVFIWPGRDMVDCGK